MPITIPKISLANANFNPISFQGTGFTPQESDVNFLVRSLDKLEQRELATSQQRGAIAKALADVELNEAEDEWKTNYANDVQDQINNLISIGDYSNALNRATILAGKSLSDPALKGRIRAQQEYKKKRDEVLARNDLNQVTKDRWLEQNPYYYEDKFDAKGNIVGGTKWESEWNPVGRNDLTKIYAQVKQLAAAEAGGGESAQFLDANGKLTNDPTKGFYGMAVKRGTKWEKLSEDKLKRVFDALFAQTPEAKDALLQDMDDRLWQYGKADDEGKKAFIGSDIMDSKGRLYTPDEYLSKLTTPVLHEMAYNHHWSTIQHGDAYSKYVTAQEKNRLQSQLDSDNPTTLTKAIEIDMSERAGAAGANLKSAMSELNKLFPNATKKSDYKNAINDGDYNKAANILTFSINPNSSIEVKIAAKNYIKLLKTEGEIYNNLTGGFTKEEKEALAYINSQESGSDVPDAANNRFSKEYANHFNDLFGVKTIKFNSSYSGKVPNSVNSVNLKIADKIAIKFRSEDQKEAILHSLGDKHTLAKSGIRIGKINGEDCIIVDKNTNRLQDVGKAFSDYGHRIFGWSNTEIYRLDANNKVMTYKNSDGITKKVNTISGRQAINMLSYFSPNNQTSYKAKQIVDNAFNKKSAKKLVEPVQIFPFDNHNTLILREMRDKGYISDKEYNDKVKEYTKNNLREVIAAAQDLNNFKVWGAKSDSLDNQRRLSESEVQEYAAIIRDAYSRDEKNGIELFPGEEPTGKGYGTVIIIHPQSATSKSPAIEGRILYVDGLLATKAAKSLANTPGALARREYKINKIANPTVNDIYGNRITFDDNEVNYKRFAASKEMDEVYNMLDNAKISGETFSKQQADDIATKLVMNSGTIIGNTKSSVDIISKKLMDYYNDL